MPDEQITMGDEIQFSSPEELLRNDMGNFIDGYFEAVKAQSLATTVLQAQLDRHVEIGEAKFQEIIDNEGMQAALNWMAESEWQTERNSLEAKLKRAAAEPDTMLFIQTILKQAFQSTQFPVNGSITISTEITKKDGMYIIDSKKSTRGARRVSSPAGASQSSGKPTPADVGHEAPFDEDILLSDERLSVVMYDKTGKNIIPDDLKRKNWHLGEWAERYSTISGMFRDPISSLPDGKLLDTSPLNPLYRIAYGMIRNPWTMLRFPLSSVEVWYDGQAVVTISECNQSSCKGVIVDRFGVEASQSLYPSAPEHLSEDAKKSWSKQVFSELHNGQTCRGKPKSTVGKR